MPNKLVKQQDPLRQVVQAIRAFAEEQSFVVFYGADVTGRMPQVYWNKNIGGDWRAFLETAQQLNAKPVYLSWSELAEEDLLGLDNGDAQAPFADKVGQVGALELGFTLNGVMHVFHEMTDWYIEFDLASDDLDEEIFEEEEGGDDSFNERPF